MPNLHDSLYTRIRKVIDDATEKMNEREAMEFAVELLDSLKSSYDMRLEELEAEDE